MSGDQAQPELDMRNLAGVEVLHLVDNPGLHEVLLSHTTVAHLRSLIVRVPPGHTTLRCIMDEGWSASSTANQWTPRGQLVWVELEGNAILTTCRKQRTSWLPGSLKSVLQNFRTTAPLFDLGLWRSFRDLHYLRLSRFPAQSIDLMTCTSLKTLKLEFMPSLRDIHGLEKLTNLDALCILQCGELVVLSIPANLQLCSKIQLCRSLERISLMRTMLYPEADCSTSTSHGGSQLDVEGSPALRKIDGLSTQYTGSFMYWNDTREKREGNMQEVLRDLMPVLAERGPSKFKASVSHLFLTCYSPGLARVKNLEIHDVQHVGLLLIAVSRAQAVTYLEHLSIYCKEDGDCGCEKDVPHFGLAERLNITHLWFQCPQVRDLSSIATLGDRLKHLNLRYCASVEVWPDFVPMTSLEGLYLSFTSLKEWPAGVEPLPAGLRYLDLRDCFQLPAEELMKDITFKIRGYPGCCSGSMECLFCDFMDRIRDGCSVADAIDSHWPEIVALIHRQWRYLRTPNLVDEAADLCWLIRIMYELWFAEVESRSNASDSSIEGSPSLLMNKLRRLLCSEAFMSLPFYVWRISRTRLADECEDYRLRAVEGFESYMALTLIGSASIGRFNASLNDDLNDRVVNFFRSIADASFCPDYKLAQALLKEKIELSREDHGKLVGRVEDAVWKMASVPSVAVELGLDFTLDGPIANLKSYIKWHSVGVLLS